MRKKLFTTLVLLLITVSGACAQTYNVTIFGFANISLDTMVKDVTLPCDFNGIGDYDFDVSNVIDSLAYEFTSVSIDEGGDGKVSVSYTDPKGPMTIRITGAFEGMATIHCEASGEDMDHNPSSMSRDIYAICVASGHAAVNLTANIGEAAGGHWATYYNSAQGYTADASTTVYQAAVNSDKNAVVLTEVTSKEIPAGQGVVLRSSASIITLTPATTTVTYSDNELLGTDANYNTPNDAYCLSKETSGVGFYAYTLASIPAHQAYLVVTGVSTTVRGYLGFDKDDNSTAIDVAKVLVIEANSTIYNLSGRIVTGQPKKGIYVKNGKKFVIK